LKSLRRYHRPQKAEAGYVRKTVRVVEDEVLIAIDLKLLLEKHGWHVFGPVCARRPYNQHDFLCAQAETGGTDNRFGCTTLAQNTMTTGTRAEPASEQDRLNLYLRILYRAEPLPAELRELAEQLAQRLREAQAKASSSP
jgi:hypothetical protein